MSQHAIKQANQTNNKKTIKIKTDTSKKQLLKNSNLSFKYPDLIQMIYT